ncbi:MAG: ergothioneine biosynthesis protein EgtB [Williamsia herbipolensis]|uniref:Hercynine oxygenase n=1 Tax=Williamsia serinedens TaxID=391736 RepID=A0ABT1H0A7_9NOCA|nr:ergothioneine biosynthesis protein EgtB [Williamsia serinedens]MBE7161676.1 ergothioneine biosynthesis protein EgtB [Williamsia herbipolensis]MCP2160060.1 iron(II)-dependent oxidoreductase [Williamsia serinedens]
MTALHDDPLAESPREVRARLETVLRDARSRTAGLVDAVSDDDLRRQHSPLMSPLVWDLAHIGNQEEMWLIREVGRRAPIRPDLDDLYDAFRHARASRPDLPLLDPTQARDYTAGVRHHALEVLDASPLSGERLVDRGFAFAMIAQHEQQHDETMLATHQLRTGPTALRAPDAPRVADTPTVDEVIVPAGDFVMGTDLDPWALDNERPAHRVSVPAFAIERFPVTNERWCAFIDDGGYERPELWSERGWAHRVEADLTAPQFWERDVDGRWFRRVFGTMTPLRPNAPVVHVCFFEAEAFARWAGKRLPTEAEWEKAARFDPAAPTAGRRYPWGDDDPTAVHANLAQRHLEPADIGAYPGGVSPLGVHQMVGDVWEWTSSGFESYPGFTMFPYPEYSEVFFGGDYRVLRGGSFGTDPVAVRTTFRNWDHPIRRQIFSGLRLARDVA